MHLMIFDRNCKYLVKFSHISSRFMSKILLISIGQSPGPAQHVCLHCTFISNPCGDLRTGPPYAQPGLTVLDVEVLGTRYLEQVAPIPSSNPPPSDYYKMTTGWDRLGLQPGLTLVYRTRTLPKWKWLLIRHLIRPFNN